MCMPLHRYSSRVDGEMVVIMAINYRISCGKRAKNNFLVKGCKYANIKFIAPFFRMFLIREGI